MWKTVLAGTTALAIAGATLAYAQSVRPAQRARALASVRGRCRGFGDARIAALHAGLKLYAEQEKNWPALETALRDLAKLRPSGSPRAPAPTDAERDPVERLAKRAQALESRGAALKKLADAAAPLYKSLDEGQKHRFTVLARLGAHHRFGHHAGREWRAAGGITTARGTMMDAPDASAIAASPHVSVAIQKPPDMSGGFYATNAGAAGRWTGRRPFANRPAPGGVPPRQSGRIAQLVEQLTLNQRVQGSSPCAPTTHSPASLKTAVSGQKAANCGGLCDFGISLCPAADSRLRFSLARLWAPKLRFPRADVLSRGDRFKS